MERVCSARNGRCLAVAPLEWRWKWEWGSVWESLDSSCADRLRPALVRTAPHLARFGAVSLTAELEEQLQKMGVSTRPRLLCPHRARKGRLPRKGPERANQLTQGVPRGRSPWETSEPGHARAGLSASWRRERL